MQVGHLKDQTRTLHNQLEAITAKLHDKDLENGKLWDQMRMAATEYQQEFLNKETTIRDLLSRNEAEKDQMREDMLKARADMEVLPMTLCCRVRKMSLCRHAQ